MTSHIVALAGMSDFETLLIGGVVTMALGVSGLVTWVIKSLLPRVLEAFEKRNEALISASEKTADAVGRIPEAIKAFELALLGAEKRLTERMDDVHDKIVGELHDKRISDLADAVRTGPHPTQPSRPGG